MKNLLRYLLAVILFGVIAPVRASDMAPVLLSAAVPGLGQLTQGQKAKGLGLMGSGLLALHFCVEQVSRYNNHVANTRSLKERYDIIAGASYDSRMALKAEWQDSYDTAQDAKELILPLAGTYALIWAAGIADALFFPPAATEGETAGVRAGCTVTFSDRVPLLHFNMIF